ncbi:MAG: group II intron reverse transcriptase/maturase, partial [Bacteroidetes bacterium]|nr:group II intron reverse transcriptase/maturase [Bacteroidota bacterium]
LDIFDKELEKRGHRFVRYADDVNIYVRSRRAGAMASAAQFLMRRLRLRVNATKSAVGDLGSRTFLGFCFTRGKVARRRIAPKSLERFQERVRALTRRTRGV